MRFFSYLLVASLFLPAIARAQSSEEEAGDVSEVDKDRVGPLRERIRPVSGHLFLKNGRLEVSPGVSLSMKDPFFTKYILGASLTYHFDETMAVGLRGGFAIPVVSGNADICTPGPNGSLLGCHQPSKAELDGRAPGQMTLLAGADFQWAPIYGKIALSAEGFLHFDLYGIIGPSLVQYKGPSTTGAGSVSETALGGNLGVGMRVFLNHWLTLRGELRDLIYKEDIQPLGNTSVRNQLLFELGFSMFIPTSFSEP